MDDLTRLGATLVEQPPIPRLPLGELERRAVRRTTRHRVGVAAAIVLVLAVAVGAVLRPGHREAVVDTTDDPTTMVPEVGDLMIYLKPDSTAAEIGVVRDELLADPDVSGIRYASQAQVYDDFRCRFAANKPLLDNVASEILPSYFRLDVRGGPPVVEREQRHYAEQASVLVTLVPSTVFGPPALGDLQPPEVTQDWSVDDSTVLDDSCPIAGTAIK